MACAGIALDLGLSLGKRLEILSQECPWQSQGPECAQNFFLFFSLVTVIVLWGLHVYKTEFSGELMCSSSKQGFASELLFCV